ncbi:class I adenylate-forming enzyme family protein [soil metagenome]
MTPVPASDAVAHGSTAGMAPEPWLGGTVWCHADQPRTIIAALDHAVRTHPGALALDTPEGSVTYQAFADLVEAAAEQLTGELGVRRGDRIAVALPNGLDLAVAIWACARAGLVLVGLPTRLQPPQWAHQLSASGASSALGGPGLWDRLVEAADQAGMAADLVRPVGDLLTGRRTAWRGPRPDDPGPDDVYALIFTSGTTGRPKGSMVTHRGTMHAAVTYIRTFDLTASDRTLLTFPLYYATAHMAQITPMMLVGGSCAVVEDVTPAGVVERCAADGITYLMVVPALWPMLLRTPGFTASDLPALRIGAFGGAPVPLTSIQQLRQRMPALRLYDAYGLTETHSPATILQDEEVNDHPGSVGRPIAGTAARVVDDEGRVLPRDTAGELQLRGPNITPGYWGDPAGTAAAIDPTGWFATGDVARIDVDGYVYLLDRKKDMIIRGGFNVYCVEVEYALVSHPDVVEAAVVVAPDRMGSEYVVAYVVAREGCVPDARALADHVRQQIADYAAPRRVHVVDALPRNRTGKIDKVALRAR